jgi:hypothetical protein
VSPEAQQSFVIFSWFAEDKKVDQFVSSLLALPNDDIPHAVIRYIFDSFENLYAKPEWWEDLPVQTKQTFRKRQNTALSLVELIDRFSLRDDGIRSVDWTLSNIKSIS